MFNFRDDNGFNTGKLAQRNNLVFENETKV